MLSSFKRLLRLAGLLAKGLGHVRGPWDVPPFGDEIQDHIPLFEAPSRDLF